MTNRTEGATTEPKTIADDVLEAAKKASCVVIPASVIASPENKKLVAEIEKNLEKEIELTPNEYVAYAMLRKKGSGGRWIMRKLSIKDGKIVDVSDSVENIAGVLLGEITYELEKDI